MSARYRKSPSFCPERPVMESLQRFARYVWYNISPDYLFIRGDLHILRSTWRGWDNFTMPRPF